PTSREITRMVVIDKEQVRLLEARLRGIGVDRRSFLKFASAAMAAPMVGSILAACGGDDEDEPEATTAPAEATTAPTEAAEEPTEAAEEPTEAAEEPTEAAGEPTEAAASP